MVTETVHFDELVRLLKNHIEEVEHQHKTSKPCDLYPMICTSCG